MTSSPYAGTPATAAMLVDVPTLVRAYYTDVPDPGEPIQTMLTQAPGNEAPLGGVKVVAEHGWFAARASGTEPLYTIYAESFRGADHLRLLWASTGTKDPEASDILYIKALAAPFTVNTMLEGTLKALAEHGELGALLPADGGDSEAVLAQFTRAGIDIEAMAAQLQDEGARAFVKSWNELMDVIASKSAALAKASSAREGVTSLRLHHANH
jgi:hypothetical protein